MRPSKKHNFLVCEFYNKVLREGAWDLVLGSDYKVQKTKSRQSNFAKASLDKLAIRLEKNNLSGFGRT